MSWSQLLRIEETSYLLLQNIPPWWDWKGLLLYCWRRPLSPRRERRDARSHSWTRIWRRPRRPARSASRSFCHKAGRPPRNQSLCRSVIPQGPSGKKGRRSSEAAVLWCTCYIVLFHSPPPHTPLCSCYLIGGFVESLQFGICHQSTRDIQGGLKQGSKKKINENLQWRAWLPDGGDPALKL